MPGRPDARQTVSTVESPTHTAALTQQPRLEFAANLDILRSVAVTPVLLDHVLELWGARHGVPSFHVNFRRCIGRLGVLLFFVHTSLVLSFSLDRIGARLAERWA